MPPADARTARAALDLLGLAARARAVIAGTDMVRRAARDGGVFRAVLAADASPTQRSKLIPLLDARGIPYDTAFTQAELGAAIGRGPVSAVGVAEQNFARRVGELVAALHLSRTQQGGS